MTVPSWLSHPQAQEAIKAELSKRGLIDDRIDAETPPDWFHEGQLKAWESTAVDVVLVAGTQGGKSAFLVYWLLREIQRCAEFIKSIGHGKAIVAGPTLTLMGAQLIPAFRDLFEDELRLGKLVMGTKPVFHFSEDGSRRLLGFAAPVTVHFAYANDPSNLESMTACCGIWDESGQKENKQASYRAYNRRLKVARSAGYGRRAFGTTPYEHNWFKAQVHDRAENNEPGFSLHRFVSWMNPLVSEAECRKELANGMPLWEWQMMYLGLYTKPAGAIFDCFDERIGPKDGETNVCEPFEIPKRFKRLLGQDFGDVHMGSLFLAEDPDSKFVYVYAERLTGGMEVEEHVAGIRDKGGLKDHEYFESACGGSWSENDWRRQFAAAGLDLSKPPMQDVWTQIHRLYGVIKNRRLKFFDGLECIPQFVTYSRELDVNGEPIPNTIQDKQKKHFVDAGRYIASHRYPFAEWEGLGYERVTGSSKEPVGGIRTVPGNDWQADPQEGDMDSFRRNRAVIEAELEQSGDDSGSYRAIR